MVLWTIMALMTAGAVMLVLRPLSARPAPERGDADIRFYEDQLAEIARDEARGALGPAEAQSARAEAGRRLLRAEAAGSGGGAAATCEPSLRRRRAASAVALSVVPLVGLAVYGVLGSPQIPAQTAADRAAASGGGARELSAALNQIEKHLAASPDDLRGWEVIAPVYLRLGRAADAARAFGEARRIGGDTDERLLGEGEALVIAAGGTVGPEPRALFEKAVGLDPASPRGRFYLALAAEQDGRTEDAAGRYRQLLAEAPSGAGWAAVVRERLAGLDGSGAPAPSVASGPATPLRPGDASPDILAMVDGLDGRLLSGGGTEAEWARLVRSFVVLGRRDEAVERLGRAKAALAKEAGAGGRLDRLAGELGLTTDLAHR